MRLPLALALLSLVVGGCVTPASTQTPAATVADLGERLMAFDAAGLALPVPDLLKGGLGVTLGLLGERGGEPNVGVTSSGAVFMTANHNTMRSTDHGATWEIVFNLSEELPQYNCPDGTPAIPVAGCPRLTRSSDPMLWVDPVTDRVFTDHMTGLYCSNMIYSDDEGDSWTMKPMTCGLPVNDHQKVATGMGYGPGAPPAGMNPAYPNPVYYCYNKLLATQCAVSFDGGLTFPIDRTVASGALGDPCGGINGHPASGPDGTMFVPINEGCPTAVVGVSEDSGLTWSVKQAPFDVGAEEIDPEITVTPDGTAYMLWRGVDHLQYLARSTDKFDTWEGPWQVSPKGVTSTVFAGLTSVVDGKVGFAFLGTRDTDEAPSDAPNGTRWHLFTGVSLDAASPSPTFVVEQASPDADPVQIGCVWLGGGANPCRNMLDFIDMAADSEGRFYVAYTEGCISAAQHPDGADAAGEIDCANNPAAKDEESRGRHGAFAVSAPLLVG
ncbi:MAG TPA: sialidase family protein [Candidatus Thermoplasmatota archaeon]|nr:sialidase family protein [Candidatus Thermoplasmatota archaeon]